MPRKCSKPASSVVPIFLAVWAAWLLRKVARDYEDQERLSTQTSIAGWVLYLIHAGLTLDAARNPSVRLPVKTLVTSLGLASMLSGAALSGYCQGKAVKQ